MLGVINYSKHIYFDRKKQWNQMIDRGMANDYFPGTIPRDAMRDCTAIFWEKCSVG